MNTKALLVVDVQKQYINRYSDKLLERINQRIEKAVKDNEIIIYIENISIFSFAKNRNPLADGLKIVSTNVFNKKKASAFSNKEVVNFLKDNNITSIEIIGVDGNYCVGSTAKESINFLKNVSLKCDCIGVMNLRKFNKTKRKLVELGIQFC